MNVQDAVFFTPLHIAAYYGHEQVTRWGDFRKMEDGAVQATVGLFLHICITVQGDLL